MNDIQRALRVLDLGINATEPEIKQSYRDLAKIWHPDRFPNDPALRLKAQDKLKEINRAYSILRNYHPRQATDVRAEGSSRGGPDAPTAATSEGERKRQPPHSPSRPTPSNTSSLFNVEFHPPRWAYVLGVVLAIGTVAYLVHPRVHGWLPDSVAKNLKIARENSGSQVPNEPAPTLQKKETPALAHSFANDDANFQTRSTPPTGHGIARPPGLNPEYFTVDSTREEVLAVQGNPTEADDRVFTYGDSKVYFSEGRVTLWDNMPGHPLKTRLLPSKPNMPNKGYFTVGSKKEEVLAVQGIPTGFDDRSFEYGASKVYFSDGRVTRWDAQVGDPLKVRIVTDEKTSSDH